ncbi:hypothetical protein KP509_20G077600 [Ceratopteris richardii]|nr:hypothetical protein KP509_20G077600 [Ceratopteris richardii]
MVSYFGMLHVPLGLGGLTILEKQLHIKDLPPESKVNALVIIILLELGGTIWLLRSSMKQSKQSFNFMDFRLDDANGVRGWIATVFFGLSCIGIAMGITAVSLENTHGIMPDDSKDQIIKQMTSDNLVSEFSTFLVFCILIPSLEEIVYRGYLLQSMASRFGWQWAVLCSSFVFTVAHFDVLHAPTLFFVGCVLGAAYTWSGNLVSSLLIHSLYNALTIYGR